MNRLIKVLGDPCGRMDVNLALKSCARSLLACSARLHTSLTPDTSWQSASAYSKQKRHVCKFCSSTAKISQHLEPGV
jgi:hypothetical protein